MPHLVQPLELLLRVDRQHHRSSLDAHDARGREPVQPRSTHRQQVVVEVDSEAHRDGGEDIFVEGVRLHNRDDLRGGRDKTRPRAPSRPTLLMLIVMYGPWASGTLLPDGPGWSCANEMYALTGSPGRLCVVSMMMSSRSSDESCAFADEEASRRC